MTFNRDGSVLEGLRLGVWESQPGRTELPRYLNLASDTADEHGAYEFRGIPPGDYILAAGFHPPSKTEYRSMAKFLPFKIANSETVTLDWEFVSAEGAQIEGSLLPGKPFQHEITLTEFSEGWIPREQFILPQADGSFTVEGVFPGPVLLESRESVTEQTVWSTTLFLRPGEVRAIELGW